MEKQIEIMKLEIEKLSLEPGDVLVIKTDRQYLQSECTDLIETLIILFPNNKTLILGPDASLEVVKQDKG